MPWSISTTTSGPVGSLGPLSCAYSTARIMPEQRLEAEAALVWGGTFKSFYCSGLSDFYRTAYSSLGFVYLNFSKCGPMIA